MSLSVTNDTPSSGPALASAPVTPVPATKTPAPVPVSAAVDSVKISPQAQVRQLNASGSTLAEIVLKTGLDAVTVKSYLGQ